MESRQPSGTSQPETQQDAIERDAFNAAFRELGLRFHWDAATFQALRSIGDDKQRVMRYLETHEPHLLKAYDATFLIDAVLAAKHQALPQVADLVRTRAARCADCADFPHAQTGF